MGGRLIKNEGVSGLFKGVGVFSLKRALDWTTRYLFVVMVEEAMRTPGVKLSDAQGAIASLAGGSISALVTIPMDVLVATVQSAGKAGQKTSGMDALREQLKGGVGNLTKGLVARVAHVALTTLMMKTVTSKVYDLLYPPKA